jgi:alpha-ketoglutarate-dependent taurine dioxygenase
MPGIGPGGYQVPEKRRSSAPSGRRLDAPLAHQLGTTNWANTVTAYEGLPQPLKALVDQLWSVHSNDSLRAELHRRQQR